jgi:hypothetical protein
MSHLAFRANLKSIVSGRSTHHGGCPVEAA